MTASEAVARGRAAFARRAWGDAYGQLAAADRAAPLAPADLERLAIAAHLTGREADSAAIWARTHHGYPTAAPRRGRLRGLQPGHSADKGRHPRASATEFPDTIMRVPMTKH